MNHHFFTAPFLMAHDSPNKIRFANFVMLRATFLKEES